LKRIYASAVARSRGDGDWEFERASFEWYGLQSVLGVDRLKSVPRLKSAPLRGSNAWRRRQACGFPSKANLLLLISGDNRCLRSISLADYAL